jgi:hypothetical protein
MAKLILPLLIITLCFGACDNNDEKKEICNNGIDDDNDSFIDCADLDCLKSTVIECDCTDGIDNDNNSFTDCEDLACLESTKIECDCSDGIDNDNDSFIDCDDVDCNC